MAKMTRSILGKGPHLVTTAVPHSKPCLATFWYYTQVQVCRATQSSCFAQLTVKAALRNGLVPTEVFLSQLYFSQCHFLCYVCQNKFLQGKCCTRLISLKCFHMLLFDIPDF
uniref:Uncharacterized protein n=1 Tax=Salvator merianae TaxID=96440 RepID=A0A8D0C2U3_SALMN